MEFKSYFVHMWNNVKQNFKENKGVLSHVRYMMPHKAIQ